MVMTVIEAKILLANLAQKDNSTELEKTALYFAVEIIKKLEDKS